MIDFSGSEIITFYDGFAEEGLFSNTYNISHFSKGVYFLQILIDGNYYLEKIIIK